MTPYIERTEVKEGGGYIRLIAWECGDVSNPDTWVKVAEVAWWPKSNSGWLYPKASELATRQSSWREAKYNVTEQQMLDILKEAIA